MRKVLPSLLVVLLASCSAPAPETAALAVAIHTPLHPRLADCISIDGRDPSAAFIASLRKTGRNVFPASQCRKSGWDVTSPKGGYAQFVAYERFVRTSPWTARIDVHSFANGMHSDVYSYNLKLVSGAWVVRSGHGVSQA